MRMKKKIIKYTLIIAVVLGLLWSAMVIIDYNRSKDLKEPLFAISTARDQHGNGYYKCLGYEIYARAYPFNGKDYVLYDMQFHLLGGTSKPKMTISFASSHAYLQLGESKEKVFDYIEALEYITPDKSGKQETYTEHANIDGAKVILKLVFYNDVLSGFEYEYDNVDVAYKEAERLRRDLELTFGEKTTYPGMVQTNKDYFDNIKNVSDLKNQYTYYEDWEAVFEDEKQENINKMLEGKDYSRIDIHFELSVIDENKAILSTRYVALP